MKKIFKTLALAVAGALFMAACDDVPSPYKPGGDDKKDTTLVEVQEITCAQAIELCSALEDNATSTETYAITGYITDVYATVSNNQQSFWMADAQDGGKQVQAYWANLPEGVEKFAAGSKVKITGKLLKYVKSGTTDVVTEVKNATVEILEAGGSVEAEEVTCAQAAELCNALENGATSEQTYAVTGYITRVVGSVSRNQQSFWMADTKDGGDVIEAFYANLPEGVSAFAAGSKVKITGKLQKYVKTSDDGTVTVTLEVKNADVVILEAGGDNPGGEVPGNPSGAGSQADPYNVAGAIAYIKTLSATDKPEDLVYTKGQISEVVKMGTSGSIQFKMSDSGVDNSLLVYYCNNLGNTKFTSLDELKVGDEVVVCGKVVNYNGTTPEYNAGAYLVSLNGKTEEPGGGDQPGGDTPGESTQFSNDLTCNMGSYAYKDAGSIINGLEGCETIKIGTSKAAGTFTIEMPAGKHTFYAVAWKGTTTADVTFSNGETVVKTVTVKGNDGATGNAPFTLTVTDEDKYEIELTEAATLTVTSPKRVIFFGIK